MDTTNLINMKIPNIFKKIAAVLYFPGSAFSVYTAEKYTHKITSNERGDVVIINKI